ncbi:hypothetical protein T459_07569 [Capsicum annuum]|uniref:Uncharacterized protein n=1 Tax=Capsicum annuum TaxID=4072 RepID=A0A2G2ZU15_CAPAN|nr:putative F-box protein-like [Capsicum annuum]PHT85463.1 hypothetical protein T459_07569 [Capsicum annuum]
MDILSKTWPQAYSTLPNLKFIIRFQCHIKIVDNIMERYRDGKIHIENFELSWRDLCPPVDKWLDIAIQNGVKDVGLDVRSGLEKIELPNLRKIKSVSIRICKNQRVKIEAPTLEHLSYFGLCLSEGLVVTECKDLKSLDLTHSPQNFNVYNDLSYGRERFRICKSGSLKILKIRNCDGIKEIDDPNLVSIEYQGKQTPELKIARESCQLKHSKIVLSGFHSDAAWFGKLQKFLSNSASWSQVSLYFVDCAKINMNDLLLHDRVAIPQVDVLDVKTEFYEELPTFVDALLLSCHPRRLNLSSSVKINKCFIDRLMHLSHSTSHGRESWHSQLIAIKAFDVKNQPLQLLEIDSLMEWEWKRIYFLLDWQCS